MGSEEWKTSGQNQKEAAVKEMRAANDASGEPAVGGRRLGNLEESLGNAVGCEGMVSEGEKKQHTQ